MRDTNTEAMVKSMNEQFGSYGVQIIDSSITSVSLPEDIAARMQGKTIFESHMLEQEKKQEFEMQVCSIFLNFILF